MQKLGTAVPRAQPGERCCHTPTTPWSRRGVEEWKGEGEQRTGPWSGNKKMPNSISDTMLTVGLPDYTGHALADLDSIDECDEKGPLDFSLLFCVRHEHALETQNGFSEGGALYAVRRPSPLFWVANVWTECSILEMY